jgi:hypothetical protein
MKLLEVKSMKTLLLLSALLITALPALAEYEFPKEAEPYVSVTVKETSVALVKECKYVGTVKSEGASANYAMGDDFKKAEKLGSTHIVWAYVLPSVGVFQPNVTVVGDAYRCPN